MCCDDYFSSAVSVEGLYMRAGRFFELRVNFMSDHHICRRTSSHPVVSLNDMCLNLKSTSTSVSVSGNDDVLEFERKRGL